MDYFRRSFLGLPTDLQDFTKSNDLDSSVVLANLLDGEVPEFSEAPPPVFAFIELAKALEFQGQEKGRVSLCACSDACLRTSISF